MKKTLVLIVFFLIVFFISYQVGFNVALNKAAKNLVTTGSVWGKQWQKQCYFIGGTPIESHEWGGKIRFSCLLVRLTK
jgi:hypothetical protein